MAECYQSSDPPVISAPRIQMALLPLANGGLTLVDDDLVDFFGRWTWWRDSKGYAVRREGKRVILLHRVVLGTAAGRFTDHINRDRLDNRRANLRPASPGENACNRVKPARSKSPHKGVRRWRRRFVARIRYERRLVYLGSFPTAELAAAAYDIAALVLHGRFAHLNRVPGAPRVGSGAWRALKAGVLARVEDARLAASASPAAASDAVDPSPSAKRETDRTRSHRQKARFQPPLAATAPSGGVPRTKRAAEARASHRPQVQCREKRRR